MKINQNKCKLCGMCVSVCPVSAISIKNKMIKIDKSLCIRCQACAATCPSEAMEL